MQSATINENILKRSGNPGYLSEEIVLAGSMSELYPYVRMLVPCSFPGMLLEEEYYPQVLWTYIHRFGNMPILNKTPVD